MSAERILALRQRAAALPVTVELVAETGSTNADLMQRLPSLTGATLRIAEQQTAGRGRAGRSWLSEPGSALMFSLAWCFAGPLHRLTGLPLAVGVALAEAMQALEVPVTLKWPNDVIKDGSKLAGILVETQAGADGSIWAVIGVGLNLLVPDQLERAIGRDVASAPWLARMDRDLLMATLLDHLTAVLDQFAQTGFAAFRLRWNQLDAYHGQAVRILDQGRVLHEGSAAGVDADGRLLLDSASGRITVLSGDVSLRLA